jgi:hypothetical protein
VGPAASTTEVEEDVNGTLLVSKHLAKQSMENSNYTYGIRTPVCRSLLRMRVLVHIAELG